MDVFVVKRLEQAKLLSDPFKLKLLEEFAGDPVTTKQVADRLGEKAPRLYRHVDALFDEGLLKLIEEKPKRGTIERYYKTVAARFEVDPELFSPAKSGEGEATELIRSAFRSTESELLQYFDKHRDQIPPREELPLVIKAAIRGSEAEIQELKNKLENWLADCSSLTEKNADADHSVAYTAFVALCPTEPDDAKIDSSQSD